MKCILNSGITHSSGTATAASLLASAASGEEKAKGVAVKRRVIEMDNILIMLKRLRNCEIGTIVSKGRRHLSRRKLSKIRVTDGRRHCNVATLQVLMAPA